MKIFSRIFTAIIMIFLYAPLVVMIFFSFNDGKSTSLFSGFSTKWYAELFSGSNELLTVLGHSALIALLCAVISTVLGTLAAVALFRMKQKYLKATITGVTNIPMMNPDIVTGISMLLFFVAATKLLGTEARSFASLLIAHVTFCLPYVILSVMPKLRQMDRYLTEAALDLGCTPLSAFFKVELPAILPGVFSGMIMAFTLSLDDFVISNFTTGQGFQTLPVYIYNMIKKRVTPDVYALYTLIFLGILALLLLSNFVQARAEEKQNPRRRAAKR